MGNLDSVVRALEECGARAERTSRRADVEAADAVVVPGVGAFPRGMDGIRRHGLCLGMQLFATHGDESGGATGLGWFEAEVRRLKPNGDGERVPHVGWNG